MRLKFNDWYLIGALIAIGFFLRIYLLSYQSFWIDEVFSVNAAKGILEHGYPLLDSGIVYGRDILNTYLMSFFMLIFGDGHFGARLISVVFGTLMIPLMYYFGREFGNRKIGFISALFVAFSVWEIAWSRQARMYQQLQFFYFLSLILFYKFMKEPNTKYFFLTAIFTILAILSHSLGYSLFIVYFLYFVFIAIKELRKSKDMAINFVTSLKYFCKSHKVVFSFASLAIILGLAFIIYRALGSIFSFSDVEFDYLNQYTYYLKNVHFLFYYFAVVGAVLAFRNFKIGLLLAISYLVPFLIVSKLIWLLHYRYIYFILPLLFLLASYAILYLAEFGKYAGKYNKIASGAIILVIGVAVFSHDFVFIPQKEYRLEFSTPQPNFAKAYSFIEANMGANDVIISGFPAVDNYYLGKADYWLEFSLSGRKSDLVRYRINGTNNEVYANATIINNLDSFKNITSSGRGWVVLDKLSARRINSNITKFIASNLTYYPEASEDKDAWSGIKVYGWDSK